MMSWTSMGLRVPRCVVGTIVFGLLIFVFGGESLAADDASYEQQLRGIAGRVGKVERQLVALREFMGKPEVDDSPYVATNVSMREVYFQALTLQQNSERLAFEHTRYVAGAGRQHSIYIDASDVRDSLELSHENLLIVQHKYGINFDSGVDDESESANENDLFARIVQANRQVNLLLERQIAPSDVYQQVTFALSVTSRVLESFPNGDPTPGVVAYEPNKTPSDVHDRLLRCLAKLRLIAELSGLEMLNIDNSFVEGRRAVPGDVYHLASIVVAEVSYMHSLLPASREPRPTYYVSRKFPSDVYQRVGLLEKQIDQLAELVEVHPDWLKRQLLSQAEDRR